jgi:hypothetical protein
MPTWLVPTLKWGGIILAIVSAIALIYVQMVAPAPAPETGEPVSEAPVTLYWILLLIGVVAAVVAFVLGRRKTPT